MAIQYNLYWSFSPGVTIDDDKIDDVTSPYTHSGLFDDVTYYYVATKYDTVSLHESALSNEVSGTPFGSEKNAIHIIW